MEKLPKQGQDPNRISLQASLRTRFICHSIYPVTIVTMLLVEGVPIPHISILME
jgi:hypothetical protein